VTVSAFKKFPVLVPEIHLNFGVCLTRDREFDRMSDGSDAVLIECGYNAKFSMTKNSLAEWCGFYHHRGCYDLTGAARESVI